MNTIHVIKHIFMVLLYKSYDICRVFRFFRLCPFIYYIHRKINIKPCLGIIFQIIEICEYFLFVLLINGSFTVLFCMKRANFLFAL